MKKSVYWSLAVVITLVLSVYQRMTGPTHPKRVTVELNGESYQQKLPRSGVQQDEIVTLKDLPEDAIVQLHYRRFPTKDNYTTMDFCWKDSIWQATLPVQPVAGKLQYYISVNGKKYPADEPLLIRFVYTFLLVIARKPYKKWLWITVGTLFVGGFVLGPLVQHVAFGPWWAGYPYGTDLTDNKTLLSFLFFLLALATMKWKINKWIVGLAVLFMIAIFSIPHSAYGSEYDYEKQELKK